MSIQSTAREFLERANHEIKRYGADRWVFLRELVQNSRDARATQIQFSLTWEEGWAILSCLDNGIGMTAEELSSYLLCLYASNKQYAAADVGYFGVGFWSVLLFEPELIRITTRSAHGEVQGTEIWPSAFELKTYPGNLEGTGTRISLYKRMAVDETLPDLIHERLAYYAQFVRPRRDVSELSLMYAGKRINGPMSAHMTFGEPFATRDFDGVIGFGPAPFVRLYKGGILVRDTTTLNQLIPSRRSAFSNKFPGLHPTVIANIDGIKVLLDRQKIYEDELLHHFVDYTETTLNRLSLKLIKQVFPLDLRNRYHLALSGIRQRHLWFGAFGLMLCIAALVIRPAPPMSPRPIKRPAAVAEARSLDFLMRPWDPSLIDPPKPQINRWDFSYQGESHLLFRVRTFDQFEPQTGLRVTPFEIVGDYPMLRIPPGKLVKIRMGIRQTGQAQILPLPPNHGLFADSVRIEGHQQKVLRTQFNEPIIFPDRKGYLTYESGALADQTPPRSYPSLNWPSFFDQVIAEARAKPTLAERVGRVTEFCQTELSYSRDESLASAFSTGNDAWLERIARTRAGDCDVLNGTLVLLLREVGVPAMLCGGLVGEAGIIQSDLHAWAYYHCDGWRTLDLTPGRTPLPIPPNQQVSSKPTDQDNATLARRKQGRALGWVLFAAAAMVMLLFWLRKARPPRLDRWQIDRCLDELIHSHLASPDIADPLQLRFRPTISLLGGRRISLHQLVNLASQGPILVGTRPLPILAEFQNPQPIIDMAGAGTAALIRHFPMLIHIEDLELISCNEALPSYLEKAESWIRTYDPDFRLHLIEGKALHEVTLHLKDRTLGSRHLILGRDNRLFRKVATLQQQPTFLVVHALVSRVTFYRKSATHLLEVIAEEYCLV